MEPAAALKFYLSRMSGSERCAGTGLVGQIKPPRQLLSRLLALEVEKAFDALSRRYGAGLDFMLFEESSKFLGLSSDHRPTGRTHTYFSLAAISPMASTRVEGTLARIFVT